MSAEVLREAARLMRERAEAATQGRWDGAAIGSEGYYIRAANPDSPVRRLVVARCTHEKWETDRGNAEHIASWHPDAALAVADWLDSEAEYVETGAHALIFGGGPMFPARPQALAVAHAYLGTAPPTEGDRP